MLQHNTNVGLWSIVAGMVVGSIVHALTGSRTILYLGPAAGAYVGAALEHLVSAHLAHNHSKPRSRNSRLT